MCSDRELGRTVTRSATRDFLDKCVLPLMMPRRSRSIKRGRKSKMSKNQNRKNEKSRNRKSKKVPKFEDRKNFLDQKIAENADDFVRWPDFGPEFAGRKHIVPASRTLLRSAVCKALLELWAISL